MLMVFILHSFLFVFFFFHKMTLQVLSYFVFCFFLGTRDVRWCGLEFCGGGWVLFGGVRVGVFFFFFVLARRGR
jgi:hypothetical protein